MGRSYNDLLKAPMSSNTPMYNPATAQQFGPGQALPGTNILQALTTPGGLEKATGLTAGWAPQIGHIKTNAATATKRRTNPLLAPIETGKRKNPFLIEQVPDASLFGLNIPV